MSVWRRLNHVVRCFAERPLTMGFFCQFFMIRVGAKATIAPNFEPVVVSGKEKIFFVIRCQIGDGNEWTGKKRFSEVKLCSHSQPRRRPLTLLTKRWRFALQFMDLREQIISSEDTAITAAKLERSPVQFPASTLAAATAKQNRVRILKLQLWCVHAHTHIAAAAHPN